MSLSKIVLSCFALSVLCSFPIRSQEYGTVDWGKVERHSADSVSARLKNTYLFPKFLEDGKSMFYNCARGDSVTQVLVNLSSGETEPLIPSVKSLLEQIAGLSGDTIQAKDFTLYNVSFEDNERRMMRFRQKGKDYIFDRKTGKLSFATKKASKTHPSSNRLSFGGATSSDSLFTMYREGLTLVLRDNRHGTERRLRMAHLSSVYSDKESPKVRREASGFWAGHAFVHYTETKAPDIGDMWQINSLSEPRPELRTMKMPLPGEDNYPKQCLFVYDADRDKEWLPKINAFGDQEITLSPHRSSDKLYFSRTNRAGDTLQLCRLDLKTGIVRTLIEEDARPMYNLSLFNFRVLGEKGDSILWWSERDGYGKYYLYDNNGRLLRCLISDATVVAGRIVKTEPERQELIIEGYGGKDAPHPLLKSYFILSLSGDKKEERITPPDYDNELELSEDGRWAFVRSSRIDAPPIFSVRDLHNLKSKPILLERIEEEEAERAGWVKPLSVSCLAADDSTRLYGVMYRPSDFDPAKKYPVIVYVYPGPQTDLLPVSFTPDENANQTLAECGFIVLQVPPRGSSPVRGKDFYTFGHGNLRDYPIADLRHSVESLAKEYPYLDLERVGIYGHSGGGFATVVSLLTYPDFYKAGVAASGNYDNNIYIQWWGERFHKYPLDGKIPTAMELAEKLSAPLLLMVGDNDRNVPPSNTLRMADALIKAGKDFEMMIFPGKDHELDSPYYFNKIKYFFLKNLVGNTENHINIIKHQ